MTARILWAIYANGSVEDGKLASGWFIENADKPANIREEDSETPWLTRETISFIGPGNWPLRALMSASSSRTGPISCPPPTTTCTGRTMCRP